MISTINKNEARHAFCRHILKMECKVTSSKNRLYRAIAGVIIIVIIVAVVFYYWQTHTNLVKITEFRKTNGGNTGDYTIYIFKVKVANEGVNTVTDLTVIVKVLGNGSELGRDTHLLLSLSSGQETPETDYTPGQLDQPGIETNATIGVTLSAVATVALNGVILDQVTISF